LEKVKLLYKTLKKENKPVFKVYLYENKTHFRTDGERPEATLERCTVFLGVVSESFKPTEITTRLREFDEFVQDKKEILKELKISVTCGAEIFDGIAHRVIYFLEDLPTEKDSGDEDEDCSCNKSDSEYYEKNAENVGDNGEANIDDDSDHADI
jgi:hypothetical protein